MAATAAATTSPAGAASPTSHRTESTITKVTVFSDRAQVTRTSTPIVLPAGEHTLVFVLPQDLDKSSMQVGTLCAAAVLKGVQFRTEHLEVTRHAKRAELEEQKRVIEADQRVLRDRMAQQNARKSLVDAVVKKVTTPQSEKGQAEDLDIAKWMQLMEFQQMTLGSVADTLRQLDQELGAQQKRLETVNQQLADIGRDRRTSQEVVQVIIVMRQAAELSVNLSYVITSASWNPLYDVRVSGVDKQVTVVYYGVVQQRSPENWTDVELELSTARPQFGGNQPQLSPWYLNVSTGYDYEARRARRQPGLERNMMMQQMMVVEEAEDCDMSNAFVPPMETVDAAVSTKATAVFFTVAGRHTIEGDNQPVKVTIMQNLFPAHFRYSTVPKLEARAYLKARVVNVTEYSLLPGEANVFLDNNFVATTSLELVAPTQDFWVFLGVDDTIQVKHKLVRRFEQTEGWLLSSKRRRIVFEYSIEIKNFKQTTEEVVMWDQLPITQNKQITVEILEPKYEKDTDTLKKNSSEFLEWFFHLAPGQAVTVPFKFAVEHPQDVRISGL